ncbi:membrane alanyl aminopeptidase-like isoform X2 [Temnothorax longispinosus]|uniref:membrane alanyl aminopeptidase-like isoform X2 n=1 Tax=Temnothorax longispinosus TaxID=300112 RepID=UPI003A98E73D
MQWARYFERVSPSISLQTIFFRQNMAVTPDDLWSAIQSAKDDASWVPYMRDQKFRIKEVIMDTWIVQNRYPVLNVTMNYETGEVAITQKCFHATEDINNKWWIPISYTVPDFSNTMLNNWLKPDETLKVQINTRDWIIVNLQQTGEKIRRNFFFIKIQTPCQTIIVILITKAIT